jgi:large subunit ribosomal protein L10
MPTEAKRETVDELKAQLADARTMIVSEYRGLRVKEIAEIRRALRKQDVSYRVVKNRLMRIAAQDTPVRRGPLVAAHRADGHRLRHRRGRDRQGRHRCGPAVQPGRSHHRRILGTRSIDADGVTRLASLPSREVLLAEAIGAVAAPMATMAGLFDAPLRDVVGPGRGAHRAARQRGRGRLTAASSFPKTDIPPSTRPT